MKILVKYILKNFMFLFLFFFISFLSLFVIVDLFDKLSDLLQYEITFRQIIYYYFNFIPELIVMIIPLSVLLASISFFKKISSNNEYVAMVQGGFSLANMMMPLSIFVLLLCFLGFWVQNVIVPHSYFRKKKIEIEHFVKKGDTHKKIINRVRVFSKKKDVINLIYIEKYFIDKKCVEGLTIIEKDAEKPIERKRIIAKSAKWNGREWILVDVTILDRSAGYIEEKKISRPSMMMELGVKPDDFILSKRNPKIMSLSDLKSIARQVKASESKEYYNLMVEYYKRYAFPFSSFILFIVSVPFGLMQKRGHKFLGIGIGIFIGLVFYLFQSVFWALGKGGIVNPFIASWAGNFIFLFLGAVFLKYAPK